MQSYTLKFPSGATEYIFETGLEQLWQKAPAENSIIITDAHVAALYGHLFSNYRVLTIPAGEQAKTWQTVELLVKKLIDLEADRQSVLVGIGGGVVTDITGFVAGIYMRGIRFGFVPTTVLGMVDAAIGGKNGVNVDMHKNMIGTIRQPAFIFYYTEFLLSLPDEQWSNGFAEVIKYGHIADTRILSTLQHGDIAYFQKHPQQLGELIAGCVDIKNKIVHADEQENGLRKMLNFGHTAGHAFETLYQMPHGYAVGLGMLVATRLSERHTGLPAAATQQLQQLLAQYHLPVTLSYDAPQVMNILKMDKKRTGRQIDFILLDKPGVATIHKLPVTAVEEVLLDRQ